MTAPGVKLRATTFFHIDRKLFQTQTICIYVETYKTFVPKVSL